MYRISILLLFLSFGFSNLSSQCIPPELTIVNLPIDVCEDQMSIPLVGEPAGGFFLIDGMPADFFRVEDLAVGSHPVTYVLVYDISCPPANTTQIVTIHPSVEITVLDDTITCLNPTAQLSLTSSVPIENYQWFGPNGYFSQNPVNIVTTPGEYFVIADNSGCTASEFINIYQNTLPPQNVLIVGDTIDCLTNTATLSVSSTSPAVNYNWVGPGGDTMSGPIVEAEQAGDYLVNIVNENNGCLVSSSVEVLPADLPSLSVSIPGVLDCINTTTTLNASSTDAEVSFEWELPNGDRIDSSTIEATMEGLYIVFVSDDEGCTSTDTVEVLTNTEIPEIEFQQDATSITCSNSSVNLSVETAGNNSSFEWSDEDDIVVSANSSAEINEAGLYYLNIINMLNGCDSLISFEVGLDTLSPSIFINQQQTLCNGSTGILSAMGTLAASPIEYSWSQLNNPNFIDSGADTVIIDQAGTYILNVIDGQNGCTASGSLQVEAPEQFPSDLSINHSSPDCEGDNGRLVFEGEVGAYLFSFAGSDFSDDSIFDGLSAGEYLVSIEDELGCQYDSVVSIISNELTINITPREQQVKQGQEVELALSVTPEFTSIGTAIWLSEGDTLCIGCQVLQDTFMESAFVSVSLTNEFGCIAVDQARIFVNKTEDIYLGNAFSPNGDGNNDLLLLHFGASVQAIEQFVIFDRWGSLIYETPDDVTLSGTIGWDGNYQGQPASTGTYVYSAQVLYIDGRVDVINGDFVLLR